MIFRSQNRYSKYKTSVSTDVLEKVRKMNINISLWNMLAVALFRGSKRLNYFLKSFHWQTGSERGCVSWELLLSAYSPAGILNPETEKSGHNEITTQWCTQKWEQKKDTHSQTNHAHRHKKREKGRYIRGKCRMRYACRLKQTQRQPLWKYIEMQQGGSRRKRHKKYKQNGTQSVKDIQKQQERLINGDTERCIWQIGKKQVPGQRDAWGRVKHANKQQDIIGQSHTFRDI